MKLPVIQNESPDDLPTNRPETFGLAAGHYRSDAQIYTAGSGMTYVDLLSLAPQVSAEGHKPAVQRVMQGDGANLILGTFAPGQALNDHRAAFPITVQCLRGQLRFTCLPAGEQGQAQEADQAGLAGGGETEERYAGAAGGGEESVILRPGNIVHVPARVVHRVDHAGEGPAVMLLTMLT